MPIELPVVVPRVVNQKSMKNSKSSLVDHFKGTKNAALIKMKDRVKLVYPTNEAVDVCYFIEKYIRSNPSKIFHIFFLKNVYHLIISNFKDFLSPCANRLKIIQNICSLYLRIRLNHEAQFFVKLEKYIRRIYSKLILYKGQ